MGNAPLQLLNCLLDKYDLLCKITNGYGLFRGNE